MRPFPSAAIAAVALASLLAGCADDGGGAAPATGPVAPSAPGLGSLIGVVVDAAIRPIDGATVTLAKPDGGEASQETGADGTFAFADLQPGAYVVKAYHPSYSQAQSSAEVVADVDDPPMVRILLDRLFEQDPYAELIKFDGYLACSYSFPVGSTCVNDYTRLNCIVSPPAPCLCPGGCLRDYNVSQAAGNIREFVVPIGPGWQQALFETVWEPTAQGTSPELTISVSYATRVSTSHYFAGMSGPSPMRLQMDLGEKADGANAPEGEPEAVGPEGRDDVFVFFNNGGGPGSLTINQPFQHFLTTFYYGVPPDGWSFVAGDPMPF